MGSEEKSKHAPTPAQRKAVEHTYGPMLVVAGAGCGKTRVLTERIAHLVRSGTARPVEILAVTFTKNAAAELRHRVVKMLPDADCSELKATTFHSYCTEVLSRAGRTFEIVDDFDLKVYLRQHIAELPLHIFTKAATPAEFIDQLLSFNARCKDELVGAAEFEEFVAQLKRDVSIPIPRVAKSSELDTFTREELLARCDEIAAVYTHVTNLLSSHQWGTYGDLLHETVSLLRSNPSLLERERQRCRFILIDEFQDSNFAQIELASLLSGTDQNVFVVGDPDQAIYRFRGATSEAFEEFKRRYRGCRMVSLEDNFRSTPQILTCAHAIIDGNPATELVNEAGAKILRPPLRAANRKGSLTQKVDVLIAPNWETEAFAVADTIEALERKEGCSWSDFAVLYRMHDHRDLVLAELEARGIPAEVTGVDLVDTSELRDLLAAAQAAVAPDDSVALFRTAALPCFAIEPEELRRAMAHAERGTPLVRTLQSVTGGAGVLAALRDASREAGSAGDALAALAVVARRFAIPESKPVAVLRRFVAGWMKKPICEDRSLASFVEYLEIFRSCGGKLSEEREHSANAVQLMTVHSAKGLEFRHVFVVHCNPGSFPGGYREDLFEFPAALSRSTAGTSLGGKEQHEQEQRRLFYVAMTRAKESLTLSATIRSKKMGMPSGYCKELLENQKLAPVLQRRNASGVQLRIAASAGHQLAIEKWVQYPATTHLADVSLSASAIESYQTCPLRFKLERDWRIPGEVPASLQFGSAMHLVLKAYFDGVRAGRKPSQQALLDSFEDSMQAAGIADEHQRHLYLLQGRKQLVSFYESRKGLGEPEVLATEKYFEVSVHGLKIIGRMDRIDRLSTGAHICDYKTGRARDQKSADDSLQLGIYALAAREQNMTVSSLSFHNLENNTVITTSRTATQLADVEKTISEVSNQIRAGQFEPKKNYHCRSCAYRSICPAHEHKVYSIGKAVGTVQ